MIIKAKTQQAKGLGHQNLDLSFTKCITPNRVSKKFKLWFRIYSVPKTVGAQWQRELKRGCSCIHLCVREWNWQNQDNGRSTSKPQQVVGISLPQRRKAQRKRQTVENCTILVPKNILSLQIFLHAVAQETIHRLYCYIYKYLKTLYTGTNKSHWEGGFPGCSCTLWFV